MKLRVDELFECPGYGGCACLFRVRIYARGDDVGGFFGGDQGATAVVILSEIPQNTGTSVTNLVEQLAGRVVRHYGLASSRCLWVEHYERDHVLDDDFSLVTFAPGERGELFAYPAWSPLRRETVVGLVGDELVDRLHLSSARYSLGLR